MIAPLEPLYQKQLLKVLDYAEKIEGKSWLINAVQLVLTRSKPSKYRAYALHILKQKLGW